MHASSLSFSVCVQINDKIAEAHERHPTHKSEQLVHPATFIWKTKGRNYTDCPLYFLILLLP